MTPRERFHLWANYKSKDIPAWGDWLLWDLYPFWQKEGLPEMPDAPSDPLVNDELRKLNYFAEHFQHEGIYSAFWGTSRLPVNTGVCPGYQEEILEEDDRHLIMRMKNGVIGKRLKRPDSSMTAVEYIEYPLKGPENWEEFKRTQLDPNHPARYPDDASWERLRQQWGPDRPNIITVDAGSFYGIVRNWMGVENASYALYDEPEWMEEVMDYLADFYIAVLEKAVRDFTIDVALFWEDICFNNGPLISPAMFREFCLKPYQKVTNFLKEHGVGVCFVDCDGNIDSLVPIWIEGGVRGFYPLEAAAGADAKTLLEQYQKDKILLWGNVDKRALTHGRDSIDAELERVAPAVAMGGYIPLVDHAVPEDISYEDYCYYHKRRRELFGIHNL